METGKTDFLWEIKDMKEFKEGSISFMKKVEKNSGIPLGALGITRKNYFFDDFIDQINMCFPVMQLKWVYIEKEVDKKEDAGDILYFSEQEQEKICCYSIKDKKFITLDMFNEKCTKKKIKCFYLRTVHLTISDEDKEKLEKALTADEDKEEDKSEPPKDDDKEEDKSETPKDDESE